MLFFCVIAIVIVVTAIANKLGYNVATCDLTHIDDKMKFSAAVESASNNKIIIVLDEIDRLLESMKKNHVLEKTQERTRKLNEMKDMLAEHKLLDEATYNKTKAEYLKMQKEELPQCMDEAFLLSILDGVSDSSNRIIIATTNNPDKIERAFKRAGRLGDFVIKFGNFKKSQIVELLKIIYKPTNDDDIEYLEKAEFKD